MINAVYSSKEMNGLLILGIDTSGKTASAAVCDESRVISQVTLFSPQVHSQIILPAAKRVLEDAGLTLGDIDGIAAAKGPGSYAGLRIGLAAVKGISFANGCSCWGISTLEALAYNFRGFNCKVCSVMHARQDILYNALFEVKGNSVTRLCDDRLITESELVGELSGEDGYYAVGDYGDAFSEYSKGKIAPPPSHLKYLLASSLCFAAFDRPSVSAAELVPDYLQLTKAEKDLIAKNIR